MKTDSDHTIPRDEVRRLALAGNGPTRITAILNAARSDPFKTKSVSDVVRGLRRAGLLPPTTRGATARHMG
jgi:hypothetical protein